MTVSPAKISERKVKADGSLHEYSCDLLFLTTEVAIIAYTMARGGTLPDVGLKVEPGSVSYGYFWANRPYNLYRMKRPDGSIIAHRFDAVADVVLSREVISYRDTVLDWWLVDGVLTEEDADELEEMVASGVVPEADHQLALAAREAVRLGWPAIVAEAIALEELMESSPLQSPQHSA